MLTDDTPPRSPASRDSQLRIALGRWSAADGIPPFIYSDGGSGIRDAEGATAFPSPLAIAASFDPQLARDYGRMLGTECRAAGRNVLLGPVLDVARTPWGGRVGEGLGEDTELVSTLGGEIVAGLRDAGVLAVAKHLVANNAELGRTGRGAFGERTDAVDVVIDERTLHEVYLEPFRRAVAESGLAGIMGSYNQLNGEYACQSPALWQVVRDEWGFDGVTVPDFLFAVRDDAAALDAGMDLPGLGDPHGRTVSMVEALSDDALGRIVRHVSNAAQSVGLEPATESRPDDLHSTAALALAEQVVVAGATLLTNDGALPLSPGERLLVIAPASIDHLLTIGGSAAVPVPEGRTPELVPELREHGFEVEHLKTRAGDRPADTSWIGKVEARITTPEGRTVQRTLDRFEIWAEEVDAPSWRGEFTATLSVPTDRPLRITLEFAGEAHLSINGVERVRGFREASPMIAGPHYPLHYLVEEPVGTDLHVSVDYSTGPAISVPNAPVRPHLVLGVESADDLVAMARHAAGFDGAIVVVGRTSGEAMDVESLRLPLDQERLIEAISQAQPKTIVVSLGSGPVAMPWRRLPAAIIHLWQAGERFAPALARILSGHEPGGRLPLTFPADDDLVPLDAVGYPGLDRQFVFTEHGAVGYRGYQSRNIQPAFPFGHGLGYTTWELGASTARTVGTTIEVRADLVNSGDRAGDAVLQCYVKRPGDAYFALVGFHRERVDAQSRATVALDLPLDRLRARIDGAWKVLPGDYDVAIGLSSACVATSVRVTVE